MYWGSKPVRDVHLKSEGTNEDASEEDRVLLEEGAKRLQFMSAVLSQLETGGPRCV